MKKRKTVGTVGDQAPRVHFWREIFECAKNYRGRIILTVLFSAITGIFVAIQPFIIRYIVDEGIGAAREGIWGSSVRIVGFFCIAYIVISFLRMVAYRIALKNALASLEGALFNLRSRFFAHVQHLCMRFADHHSAGELFNCIMGSPMGNIRNYLNSILITVPYQAVALVISLIALGTYSWQLTIIMFLTACVMATLNFLSRRRVREATRDYLDAERSTANYITDMLRGMDAVKLYALEDSTSQEFDRKIGDMRAKGIRTTLTNNLENLKPEFAHYLGTAVVYFVGGFYCIRDIVAGNPDGMTVGVLYAFLSCMSTILSTLTSWLNMALQKSTATVAMQKIREIMDQTTSTPEISQEQQRSVEVEERNARHTGLPCIEFDHVTFAYENKPIFHDFSCRIGYNESVALVGSSGSGKSTFTKLVMRLYEVDEGQLRVHGRDVRDFNILEFRHSFGVVPQNPFIFQGTIWENIRIARPDASNFDIIRAMDIAHVHEFVNDLPLGWSTLIGDGALNLSGGQKQRIAIARAVLKNPDILIFDEATSALDNISERHIQAAMEELMKTHTVLIVAHRLSTIRNVDRILVFDHGQIVEEGNYDTLAAGHGMFSEMLNGSSEDKAAEESELTLSSLLAEGEQLKTKR